jgi:hypothetical protein
MTIMRWVPYSRITNGGNLAKGQHVESDVKNPAVKIGCRYQRPPVVKAVNGDGTGGAQQKQPPAIRREKVHRVCRQIQSALLISSESRYMTALTAMMVLMSCFVAAEPHGKKVVFPPGSRCWQAAVRAFALIGADQLATAGAEQGTFSGVVPVHHGHPFRIA